MDIQFVLRFLRDFFITLFRQNTFTTRVWYIDIHRRARARAHTHVLIRGKWSRKKSAISISLQGISIKSGWLFLTVFLGYPSAINCIHGSIPLRRQFSINNPISACYSHHSNKNIVYSRRRRVLHEKFASFCLLLLSLRPLHPFRMNSVVAVWASEVPHAATEAETIRHGWKIRNEQLYNRTESEVSLLAFRLRRFSSNIWDSQHVRTLFAHYSRAWIKRRETKSWVYREH